MKNIFALIKADYCSTRIKSEIITAGCCTGLDLAVIFKIFKSDPLRALVVSVVNTLYRIWPLVASIVFLIAEKSEPELPAETLVTSKICGL